MRTRIAQRLEFAVKAVLATAGIAAVAQSAMLSPQGKPRPAFEVASVKPIDRNTMRGGHEGHQLTPERFVDRTEPIQFIVRAYLGGSFCVMTATPAFGYKCPLISGLVPEWLKRDVFEIQARIPANSVPRYKTRQLRLADTPELNLMLQVLLEDRFRLKVHWETKDLPVYALTVGKNGPKLKRTPPGVEQGGGGLTTVPMPNGTLRTRFDFQASSMEEAARAFAFFFDRPVIDRTNLKGDYDFTIEYEDDPDAHIPLNPFSGLTPSALSAALASVGLKLESSKAPIKVLVIDHVEKPTEN